MRTRQRDAATSDNHLIARARNRDQAAFGMLYERHRDAAIRVARGFRGVDVEDLVNEAFIRVYSCVVKGGGPKGAFRPYLYRTIHNVALDWLRRPSEIAMDEAHLTERIDDCDASPDACEPVEAALDRSLTVRAFRSLPERWQTVLWYTEVEGLDPHEVAPLLGLKPNSVAALAYRAREGLRTAWLTAHVESAGLDGECRWIADHVAKSARHTLSSAERVRQDRHLAECARCAVIVEEVDDVGARLALVLVPMILGASAATAFVSPSTGATVAHHTDLTPNIPTVSEPGLASVQTEAGIAAASAVAPIASAGTSTAGATFVAAIAVPVVIVGGVLGGVGSGRLISEFLDASADDATHSISSDTSDAALTRDARPLSDDHHSASDDPEPEQPDARDDWARAVDSAGSVVRAPEEPPATQAEPPAPRDEPSPTVGSVIDRETEAIRDVVGGVIDTVTGGAPPEGHSAPGGVAGADISLDIVGTATPGATLSAQAAGQIYGTATVAADGTFQLTVTALPSGVKNLEVVQAVDRAYLQRLLPKTGGVLGGLLGSVDTLIDNLIAPVSLASTSIDGVSITTGS